MPEVKGITVTINGVTKTVAKMTITQNGKTKEAVFGYEIKFDTNITTSGSQYYVADQNVSVITPNSRFVAPGSALGTLPNISNVTYVLSGITYTIYVEGWYTTKACTTQVTAATVPTGNATYYAKWRAIANMTWTSDFTSIVIPKFFNSVGYSLTGNCNSRTAISNRVSSGNYHIRFSCRGDGTTTPPNTSGSFSSVGGKSMSLSGLTFTYNGTNYTGSSYGNVSAYDTGDITLNSYLLYQTRAISNVIIYSDSVLTVRVSAPKGSSNSYTNITASITYAGVTVNHVIGRLYWKRQDDEVESWSIDNGGYDSGYTTFGTLGIIGWTSISKTSGHTLSVSGYTGWGYARSITLYA